MQVRRWCRRPGREAGRCARCENQARRCFVSLRKSRPSRTLQNRQLAPQHDTRKREDPTCTTGHTLTLQPITSALQEDAPPATSSAAPPSTLTWLCHPESWPACSPPPCASCAPPRAFLSAPPPARKAREKRREIGGSAEREFILAGVWAGTFCCVAVLATLTMLGVLPEMTDATSSVSSVSKRYGALWIDSLVQRCFQNSESWTLYMLYCRDIFMRPRSSYSSRGAVGRARL